MALAVALVVAGATIAEALRQAGLRAVAARDTASARTSQLYHSRVSQASTWRRDTRPGWSWRASDALAEAARLTTPARSLPDLKTETAACLTAFDIRPVSAINTGLNASHLAYSPDGRILAVAEFKVQAYLRGRVLLYDAADGTLMTTLAFTGSPLRFFQKGNQEASTMLKFSSDGQKLALGTRGGRVWLWDRSRPGDWSVTWAAHTDGVDGLAFDPTGRWLWTASYDRTVKRWDLGEGGANAPTLAVSASLPEPARDLALGSDTLWVSLLTDSVVQLDPMSLTPKVPTVRFGYRLGTSPDRTLIAGTTGHRLDLIDGAENAAVVRRFIERTDESETPPAVDSISFGRRGTLLAGFYQDRHVRVWDIATGRIMAHFPVGGDGIGCAAFSPGGDRLAVTDHYRVMIYEIRDDTVMHVTAAGLDRVHDIAWSVGDRRLAWVAALRSLGNRGGCLGRLGPPHRRPDEDRAGTG